jgi:hypothetical protein
MWEITWAVSIVLHQKKLVCFALVSWDEELLLQLIGNFLCHHISRIHIKSSENWQIKLLSWGEVCEVLSELTEPNSGMSGPPPWPGITYEILDSLVSSHFADLTTDTIGLACSSNCALFQSASHQVIFQCNHVSHKGDNSYNIVFCISEWVAVLIILHSVAFLSTISKISHGQVCKPPKPPWLSCHKLMQRVDVILIRKGTIHSYTVGICQTYHNAIEFEVETSKWCYSWLMAFAIQIIMDISLLIWIQSPTLLFCALCMDHQFWHCASFFANYPAKVQLMNFLSVVH